MTDDLERRLRTSLSGAALPSAPDSLHAALDRLPGDAGAIGTGGRRLGLAWAMPVLVVIVVIALIAAWLPGGLVGPAGPTASPRESSSPVPSGSLIPSPNVSAALPPFWPLAADLVGPSSVAVVGWVVNFESTLRPDLFYELFWSDDGGTTWRTLGPVPPAIEQVAHGDGFLAPIHLRFADHAHGWLSTPAQLWATVDGGRHWVLQVLPAGDTITDLKVYDGQPLVAAIMGGGQPARTAVVLAEQAGRWAAMPGVAVPDATDGWLTSSGDAAWLSVARLPGAVPSSQAARLFVTTDGRSWAQTQVPPCPTPAIAIPASGASGGLAIICSPGTAAGIGPTASALSHDGSRSWDALLDGPMTGLPTALATADGETLLMGAASGGSWLYRSADGGATWTTVLDRTGSGGLAWHDLAVLPSGFGVVVLGGGIPAGLGNPDQMYLTDDGGTSWRQASYDGVSAEATPAAPARNMQVVASLGSVRSIVLTVSDQSGQLKGVRAATTAELNNPSHPLDDVVVYNRGDATGVQVVLQWDGVICDTTATLVIGPDAHAWTLEDGPAPPCDASNAPRAVVLTFALPIDATSIVVTRESAAPSPSS